MSVSAGIDVGDLQPRHLEQVARLEERLAGGRPSRQRRRWLREFVDNPTGSSRVGLAAAEGQRLVGYLLGEVRAFEFGAAPCGWVIDVGVDPGVARAGIGTALLDEICRRFRRAGVRHVRTMVRRNDVDVLSFFRANDFVGGAFVQLEKDLGKTHD